MPSPTRPPVSDILLGEWRAFACALIFLTRIALPGFEFSQQAQARAVAYFPVIGIVVAVPAIVIYTLALSLWSHDLAVLLAMAGTIILTGGFHEDGLADAADGMGGGWKVEDKLRIMKDSRLGTYGALALLMTVLLKLAALSSLPADSVPAALLLGHVVGRWSTLPLLRFTPYLGGAGSTAAPLLSQLQAPRLWLGTAFTLVVGLTLHASTVPLLIVVTLAVLLLWRWHCLRQLGGITGDTLGAANQLLELAVYLTLAGTVTL